MYYKKYLALWLLFALIGTRDLTVSGANNLSIQENQNVTSTESHIYTPIILQQAGGPIPEVDIPPGRWPHSSGQIVSISYKWIGDLTDPTHPWRLAFQSGINDWNSTTTHVVFHYYSESINTINVYRDSNDRRYGKTVIAYNEQTGFTVQVNASGNLHWDDILGFTTHQRQNVAEHEVGHMISIGHIPRNFAFDTLMVDESTFEEMEIFYTPQDLDVVLVNQVYP